MLSSKKSLKPILNMLGLSFLLGLLAAVVLGYLYDRYLEILVMAFSMSFSIWLFNSLLYVLLIPKITSFPKGRRILIELMAFFATSFVAFILTLFILSRIFSFDLFQGKVFLINLLLLLFLFVMISGLIFSFRFYKEMKEKEVVEHELKALSAEAELKALKSQINPHFLFNTLHSINALVTHDPQTARRMIARLSDLLRISLENRDKMFVPLHQELAFAHLYLEIEKIRFGKKLNYQEKIDHNLLDAPFPSLVLQPLLENAVKHGIASTSTEGYVRLTIQEEKPGLRCTVTNSLSDRRSKRAIKAASDGTGLANIRRRLTLLYDKKYVLFAGEADERTFEVNLSIPLDKDYLHG
jgi:sensor histidine kinase YesM